jgi:hypothetical protein
LIRPATTQESAPVVHVQVWPPEPEAATTYFVIAEPPFDAGATHVTVACALPAVAATPVGAPGGAAGLTAFEAVDGALVPVPFVAVTVNV